MHAERMEAKPMRQGIALIAFTGRGQTLAEELSAVFGGVLREKADLETQPLEIWTEENFRTREALIFVGAVGIAVRAIARHVQSKAEDPAVVCVDEMGRWAIPILSGHLGGGRVLARQIAEITGGEAVITTATDINAVFAVDLWARAQGMRVLQPERIRQVSAKVLRGERILITCPWQIEGTPPPLVSLAAGGDVMVSCRAVKHQSLQLVPRILTLGIGCRRGTKVVALKKAFARFCEERGILPEAVEYAATINVKCDEEGILSFCREMEWPLRFCSAKELSSVPGDFTASAFVQNSVGVDNVCERAAVLVSGGRLVEKKYAFDGVAFALAERQVRFDWSI